MREEGFSWRGGEKSVPVTVQSRSSGVKSAAAYDNTNAPPWSHDVVGKGGFQTDGKDRSIYAAYANSSC